MGTYTRGAAAIWLSGHLHGPPMNALRKFHRSMEHRGGSGRPEYIDCAPAADWAICGNTPCNVPALRTDAVAEQWKGRESACVDARMIDSE